MRREIDARILIKDLASKADVARGLKTIPFGLSKDDVNQMIEFATSNFLRTVQGIIYPVRTSTERGILEE